MGKQGIQPINTQVNPGRWLTRHGATNVQAKFDHGYMKRAFAWPDTTHVQGGLRDMLSGYKSRTGEVVPYPSWGP